MKYPLAGELQRESVSQLTGNPRAANPAMTTDQAIAQFYALIKDPDPSAMQIAEDIALEHKLSLADLGEAQAKFFEPGWASSLHTVRSMGQFELGPDTDVGWHVYEIMGARLEIEIIYFFLGRTIGPDRDETRFSWSIKPPGGAREVYTAAIDPGPKAYYRTLPEARRAAAADAWATAKRVKQFAATRPNIDLKSLSAELETALRGPDPTAPELYEHRSTRKLRPTYVEAQDAILAELRRAGWTLSARELKIPHATSPNGTLRLWFKPRAVHYTRAYLQGSSDPLQHRLHSGRTTHTVSYDLDIRTKTPSEFLQYIQTRYPWGFR